MACVGLVVSVWPTSVLDRLALGSRMSLLVIWPILGEIANQVVACCRWSASWVGVQRVGDC